MQEPILQKSAELFTDKPKDAIEIVLEPKNRFHKLLIRLGIKKPETITYHLKPVLVGNRVRIASRAVLFPKDAFKDGVLNGIFNLSVKHNNDLIYIAAVAIQNDRNEPAPFLLEELKWVEDSVLLNIIDHALSQVDLNSFMKSTILITGTEIMKMGLEEKGEIIASGQ